MDVILLSWPSNIKCYLVSLYKYVYINRENENSWFQQSATPHYYVFLLYSSSIEQVFLNNKTNTALLGSWIFYYVTLYIRSSIISAEFFKVVFYKITAIFMEIIKKVNLTTT